MVIADWSLVSGVRPEPWSQRRDPALNQPPAINSGFTPPSQSLILYPVQGDLVTLSAKEVRAAPGRSWAVAVCVCVKYIIYSYLTVCINTKPGTRQATHLARACHWWSHN